MKINFILPVANFAGGVRVVSIYAANLMRMGHDVSIYSIPQKGRSLKQIVKDALKFKFSDDSARKPASHVDGTNVPHYVLDIHRPIIASDLSDADVVIATWWETAEWIEKLPKSKGCKVYFLQHYEIFDYLPIDRVKRTWTLPFYKITISKWLVDLAVNTYGDNDVVLIPNSVDQQQFFAPPRSRNRTPVIGMLYGAEPWKGVAISVAAYKAAKLVFPDLKLIVFGARAPVQSDFLPAECEFHLLPPQERIRDIYSRCDFWLCGSWSEGFHLPPSEAMACRCPVVSTLVGGPMDIIQSGLNGYLSPCGDAAALAENLIAGLSLSNEDWIKMSNNAFQTVSEYTWDDASLRFEAALKKFVDSEKPDAVAV